MATPQMTPVMKKPKLDGDTAVSSEDGVVQIVATVAGGDSSAVTALASVALTNETTMIFSGHRDGTIRRWDITTSSSSSSDHDNNPQQQQREPVWTISACTDLTQHELYGQQERLGIAGLAVRNQQPDSSQQQQQQDNTKNSASGLMLLYSWNHQREDMRDINGIPQKIMIWKCSTGERCSALMVDVGRCTAGTFANPLVSCLVFCKLLVEQQQQPTRQPQKQLGAQSVAADASISTTATAAVEKVWIDTVLVGLLATCDPPSPPSVLVKAADVVAVADDADASTANNSSAAAAALAPVLPLQQAKSKPTAAAATVVVATGNLVPFREHTRQRMTPWVVPGGFVRALATVPNGGGGGGGDSNSGKLYVISVTETTTSTARTSTAVAKAEDPNAANDAATEKASSNGGGGDGGTTTTLNDATTTLVVKEEGGGEAHAITLWDITQPGVVLHILKLYDVTTKEWTSSLRGSVYGITLSENLLLLTFAATEGGNGLLGVVDLSQGTNVDEKDDVGTNTDRARIRGSYEICPGSASTAYGDLVALSGEAGSEGENDIKPNVVSIYSVKDLSKAVPAKSSAKAADVMRQLEKAKIVLPQQQPSPDDKASSAKLGPAALFFEGSHLIAGYNNGAIVCAKPRIRLLDSASVVATNGSNEFASCSTASLGLRGQLCPHLASEANKVPLQNQCTII